MNSPSSVQNSNAYFVWLVLLGLLFLRIPFLGGLHFLFPTSPIWIDTAFQIGTYLLTAILIWWERENLSAFHIDSLSDVIFLFSKPIQTLLLPISIRQNDPTSLAFPNWPGLVLWVISVGLFIGLFRTRILRHSAFTTVSFRWFLVGALVGLLIAIVYGYILSFQIDTSLRADQHMSIMGIIIQGLRTFPYQIGYAAITEEPLFRGFLWGYLHKSGWRNTTICFFQAGLFTLAHIYYVNQYPLTFWIIIPITSLLLGLLVWRSRTISSSIATHAMANAMSMSFGFLIKALRS